MKETEFNMIVECMLWHHFASVQTQQAPLLINWKSTMVFSKHVCQSDITLWFYYRCVWNHSAVFKPSQVTFRYRYIYTASNSSMQNFHYTNTPHGQGIERKQSSLKLEAELLLQLSNEVIFCLNRTFFFLQHFAKLQTDNAWIKILLNLLFSYSCLLILQPVFDCFPYF